MTQHINTLRSAMTAIAAVLALSSTPALAQSVDAPPPVADTSPSPDPVAADPLSPEVASTPAVAEPVASETTATPAPVTKSVAPTSRPVARTTTKARSSTVTRTATAPFPAAKAAPAAPAAPAPEDALVIPPEIAAPAAAPVAAPADPALTEAPVAIDHMTVDEALPYAGAAGIGLLGLLGAGMVSRRRRRRREDELEEAKWQQIVAADDDGAIAPEPERAEIAPAPAFVRPEPAAAAPIAAASGLPDGFDTSKFGRHVQAAYAGPSPDNPSQSLKRRLTVGHFLDKKEAEALGREQTVAPKADPGRGSKPVAKPQWASGTDSDFMFRRPGPQPSLKPAYQK